RDADDPAGEPRLLEDRFGELGPGAVALRGEMPDTVRSSQQLARGLGEVPNVGRAAPLVVDDANLLLPLAELEHRAHEVLAGRPEEPGAANDPAVVDLAFPGELRSSVERERVRLVGLDVGLALLPVADVVRREVDDRRS